MELLQEVTWPPRERPLIYVCGPTPFVDKATFSLIALGHEPGRVLHVAFGPTGV
jgi:ferredoxin-NADP reductase